MLLSSTEYWNLPRVPEVGPHVETYALRFTDLKQNIAMAYRQSVVLKTGESGVAALAISLYDLKNPENNLVMRDQVPLSEARIEKDIFYFAVGGGEFYQNGSHGLLVNTSPELEWQLRWEPSRYSFRYLPLPALYKGSLFPTKLVSANPDIQLTGWLNWQGRHYDFNQVTAHQYHLWGQTYPQTWTWGQVSQFDGKVVASFEGAAAEFPGNASWTRTPKIFRIVVGGHEYRLNRPWHWNSNRSASHVNRWHFEGRQGRRRFVGDVFVEPDSIVGTSLLNADGTPRYRYRSETARLRLQVYERRGRPWQLVQELNSLPAMAYEFGRSEPLAHIPLRVAEPSG